MILILTHLRLKFLQSKFESFLFYLTNNVHVELRRQAQELKVPHPDEDDKLLRYPQEALLPPQRHYVVVHANQRHVDGQHHS